MRGICSGVQAVEGQRSTFAVLAVVGVTMAWVSLNRHCIAAPPAPLQVPAETIDDEATDVDDFVVVEGVSGVNFPER